MHLCVTGSSDAAYGEQRDGNQHTVVRRQSQYFIVGERRRQCGLVRRHLRSPAGDLRRHPRLRTDSQCRVDRLRRSPSPTTGLPRTAAAQPLRRGDPRRRQRRQLPGQRHLGGLHGRPRSARLCDARLQFRRGSGAVGRDRPRRRTVPDVVRSVRVGPRRQVCGGTRRVQIHSHQNQAGGVYRRRVAAGDCTQPTSAGAKRRQHGGKQPQISVHRTQRSGRRLRLDFDGGRIRRPDRRRRGDACRNRCVGDPTPSKSSLESGLHQLHRDKST